jgi:hypothetical protein
MHTVSHGWNLLSLRRFVRALQIAQSVDRLSHRLFGEMQAMKPIHFILKRHAAEFRGSPDEP